MHLSNKKSMDWQAVLSSPIACEYLNQEQLKSNSKKEIDKFEILSQWEEVQNFIKKNAKLKNVIIDWQNQFRADPRKISLNPKLAQVVLALNLEEDK